MKTGRLEGKRAVIIGGGQTLGQSMGTGRATALLFAREGDDLLLVGRGSAGITETRRLIAEEGGTSAILAADITNEEDCCAISDDVEKVLGGVDILYNGVGILGSGTA